MSDFNKKDEGIDNYFGMEDKENIESNNYTEQTNIDETNKFNIDNEINSKDEVEKEDDKNFSDIKSKNSNDNIKSKKVKKKSGFKRVIALVAGAVIVAILGGTIGASGVYYAFKNSIPVSTLENNSNTQVNPPAFKVEDGA